MINVNVGGPIQADCRYKTKVLKGNLSFESQVTDVNTKYIVKWDFSLNQDITMPEYCIIEFDGGSINGNSHRIYGVDTVMIYNQLLSEILFDVDLEGTWIHKNGGYHPDNEDITAIDGSILKFANKAYDAAAFSGLGRKYLRKNIVDVYDDNIWAVKIINGVVYVLYAWRNVWYVPYNYKNGKGIILRNTVVEEIDGYNIEDVKTLFPDVQYLEYTNDGSIVITLPNGSSVAQSALDATTKYPFDEIEATKRNILNQEEINEPNTIYIIQYDYDLYDRTIVVPENSVLLFDGGSLVGGDLNLNGTKILPNYNEVVKSTLNLIGNPAFSSVRILENGIIAVYNGAKFVEADGAEAGVKRNGTSTQRPSSTQAYTGFQYFDTTLGYAIWLNDVGEWVDATGSVVNE